MPQLQVVVLPRCLNYCSLFIVFLSEISIKLTITGLLNRPIDCIIIDERYFKFENN